ncbi:MAG TPA: GIY-YIG nuclease family protein [Atribacterota bacterium]|nr:GIY-YIG nuclease family protein [Atribacterota bacterium]
MKVNDKLTKLILQANGSTYLLLIYVCKFHHLLVGKLGRVKFDPGYYIYLGSAKKSIQKRLLRHLKVQKNKFWHIDYLLSSLTSVKVVNIWVSKKSCECAISQEILKSGIAVIIQKGFGSSDCRCPAHLFKVNFSDLESLKQLITKKDFYPLSEL